MKEGNVGFALVGIKTEQYATFKENYKEKAKIGLNTGLEFKFNKEDKIIAVVVAITFEQNKKAFLKLQVSCHFKISEDSFKGFCDNVIITFPKGFMTHLTMITVSSVRGVLHAKTEGTIFNKYLLPTLNVTKMVKENVEFSIDS
ncbi:hypothetical protein [Tenacibaculum ovolyticum]|uniref:hypothetical protein n=1 Tax=Tenacibaculum ovolyticum TaxID=104270 RepID=UPI0007ECC605|nr:hypothetical protein [Tenacibaculum ovolyticum]